MIYYAVWDYRNLQSETTSSDNIQKEYNVGLLLRLHSSHQFLVQPYTYASYNICIIYDFIYCLCSQIMMCNFYISMRLTTISPTGKYNLHFVNWWIENISLYQSKSAGKFNYMIYMYYMLQIIHLIFSYTITRCLCYLISYFYFFSRRIQHFLSKIPILVIMNFPIQSLHN